MKRIACFWMAALAVPALCPCLALAHDETGGAETVTSVEGSAAMETAATDMAHAAQNFWASLTPDQQAKASFPFDSGERFNWHFIPRERKGITWNDMSSAQQHLAHAFLASGLSSHGYQQAVTIMSLDQILKEMEQGRGPRRDPNNYAFSVFGTPGEHSTWGWRVEGHHLSINITIAQGKAIAAGPVFFGSNPAEVREGPRKGLRVLALEEDLGFELVGLLTDAQKQKAVIQASAPNEIITGNSRKADPGPPVGIVASEMTPPQKKLLMTLVEQYAYRLRPELANDDLKRIEQAGWEKIHFAWAGALHKGEAHYYRIHGPTFLVEFDNTQNNANHIHTVWRDSRNDWGEDILRQHYDEHRNDPAHGHDAQ